MGEFLSVSELNNREAVARLSESEFGLKMEQLLRELGEERRFSILERPHGNFWKGVGFVYTNWPLPGNRQLVLSTARLGDSPLTIEASDLILKPVKYSGKESELIVPSEVGESLIYIHRHPDTLDPCVAYYDWGIGYVKVVGWEMEAVVGLLDKWEVFNS